jgi:choloylglycine hydrolase
MLDNFATVAEAVTAPAATPLRVATINVAGAERMATVHLALSDVGGDSAIVEYIDGQQVIHHSRDYQVMTNSPIFAKQLAITGYWEEIGGTVMLPGTNRAADRFGRASLLHQRHSQDRRSAACGGRRFQRDAQRLHPYGFATSDEPNISTTLWRTVIDHKDLRYFFESALSPNTFWVDLRIST